MSRRTALTSSALISFFCVLVPAQNAEGRSPRPTKVILAASTFSPAALTVLQPVADQVAQTVDQLIPGQPLDYPADGIICFEAPARWSTPEYIRRGFSPPPVTVSGDRVYDEPAETKSHTIRIAVIGVQPDDKRVFAFQLAHELGHVKMGVRTDNYLDETFAVALSYEVLHRLGFEEYQLRVERAYLAQLPVAIQSALASKRWSQARTFWREQARVQDKHLDNRAFQTLGAVLILSQNGGSHWAELFNAGESNLCADSARADTFQICEPDISRMQRQLSFLRSLGLR